MDELRTKLRKQIVTNITEAIRSVGLPDHITGFLVRTFHVNSPIYSLFFVMFLPIQYAFLVVVFALCVLMSSIFFKGCVLTGVEKELCSNSASCEEVIFYTTIDPFILIMNDEVNKKTRFKYSVIVVLGWVFTILSTFCLRLFKTVLPSFSLPIRIKI